MRIKSIKYIGKREVMDLSVDDNENYFFENGVLSHNSSLQLVQDKFWNWDKSKYKFPPHLEGEKPRHLPVVVVRPEFFANFNQPISKDEIPFGFKLNELSDKDFKALVDFKNLPSLQEKLILKLGRKIRANKNFIQTKEDLDNFVDDSGLNKDSKESLKMKLENIFLDGFISENNIDIIDLLQRGYVITLNLSGFNSISTDFGFPQLAIAILRRKIAEARINGRLKKRVLLVMDESNRFVPNERDTSCKLDIIESIETERSFRVDYIFVYQTIGSVVDSVMSNSRYVMIPSNAELNVFIEAFKSSGVDKGALNQRQVRISELKSLMKKFPYCWVVIDRFEGKYDIVKFFSPMSAHQE